MPVWEVIEKVLDILRSLLAAVKLFEKIKHSKKH
jgi:hypothetical protein